MARFLIVLAVAGCAFAPRDAEPASARATVPELLLAEDAPRFLVCGHRGAYFGSGDKFARALEQGADLVEADIQRTRDGVLVVEHDPWPREKNYAETGLPKLRELLAWAEGRTVIVMDVKEKDPADVVALVREMGALDRVVFLAEHEREYRALRAEGDDTYLMVRPRSPAELRDWLARDDKNAILVHGDLKWLTPALVKEVQATGRRVFVNSYRGTFGHELFGGKRSAARVFAMGIDIAQTNDPGRAARARDAAK